MDFRAIGMGLLFALIWSSAFTSARIIVADAPPFAISALRFAIAGVLGVAIARAMGQSWHLTREQWRATLIFGLCQNALYLGLNFMAMTTVEASLASIIASTMPLMVALAGWVFLGDKLNKQASIGLILGFAGVIVIMGSRMSAGVDMFGVGLCLVGAAALTIATLMLRGASTGGNLMMIVGLQMFVGAAVLFVASLVFETWEFNWNPRMLTAFAYTIVAPGLFATWIWFTLVNRIGAVRAATFHFLNPFFGVLIAALLLGESLGVMDYVGVAVISVGILLVQLSKQTNTAK
ncbi:DMT family transporter [Shimia thalassica]|jgi:drug/metabolite transporter (DMT)-like permease|uniref:DMT family transporter n=1 Tax=Shimia thalassica TaxID=1715693 RepID=UPI000C079C44|nr:DMT family transporter [Shimia thalassica]PHO05638.1 EamA family transporter [Rhodobacteraceae bacterium 4F10]MBU2944882.1 DMT family transporter [Shimia thalassica]MDO6480822.1 DMT family transporter [Shimia thalassica]MDO6504812.1 DMT family transporter [Shimia thalassica]MDO6799916.1 DMT family transporter [Shimia thalassica]